MELPLNEKCCNKNFCAACEFKNNIPTYVHLRYLHLLFTDKEQKEEISEEITSKVDGTNIETTNEGIVDGQSVDFEREDSSNDETEAILQPQSSKKYLKPEKNKKIKTTDIEKKKKGKSPTPSPKLSMSEKSSINKKKAKVTLPKSVEMDSIVDKNVSKTPEDKPHAIESPPKKKATNKKSKNTKTNQTQSSATPLQSDDTEINNSPAATIKKTKSPKLKRKLKEKNVSPVEKEEPLATTEQVEKPKIVKKRKSVAPSEQLDSSGKKITPERKKGLRSYKAKKLAEAKGNA